MKKILAIAIAFVMVFAIASVAFAAIGFPAVAVPKTGVTLDVVGLEATSGAIHIGDANNYVKYDQTKGVTAGTDIAFMVTLTTLRHTASSTFAPPPQGSDTLSVEASNIAETTANGAVNVYSNAGGVIGTSTGLAGGALTAANDFAEDFAIDPDLVVSDAQNLTTYILFTNYEIAETKDAVIKATWRGVTESFNGDGTHITIKNAAGKEYDVLKTVIDAHKGSYAVTIPSGKLEGFVVTFYGDSFDGANYNALYSTVTGPADIAGTNAIVADEYRVVGNNTIVDLDTGLGGALDMMSYANEAAYAAYKGAYDEVCAIFGWTFNGAKNTLLNDDGFESFAGSTNTVRASWTYYAYTKALTVAGTAAVPDTGDMSIVGIALVVVAVIATAAVVIKKVRA